jgi:hypothetical protein
MIEIFIIVGLLVYIGFLYYRLRQNKSYINTIKQKEYSKPAEAGDIKIENQHSDPSERLNSNIRHDFFSQDIIDFIFSTKGTKTFMHYTAYQSDADSIVSGGFQFVTSFYKTAEEVRNDMTDLAYKHNRLSAYGKFVVVISIDKELYRHFLDETLKISSYDVFVEQILTEKPPFLNEDSDMIYTLHHKFIKGYFDYQTGKIVKNPDFNPSYCSGFFEKNLKKLIV